MSEYTPDCWVIVELTFENKSHYRVFAGWYGGYLNGDSWKMNSGITDVETDDEWYHIYGESGSVYHCHKEAERMSMYMRGVLQGFMNEQTETRHIDLIDFKDMVL